MSFKKYIDGRYLHFEDGETELTEANAIHRKGPAPREGGTGTISFSVRLNQDEFNRLTRAAEGLGREARPFARERMLKGL